jgi:RNA-directed DNA polymerase
MNKIELLAKLELLDDLKSEQKLAELLEVPLYRLQLMAINPDYSCYYIKKGNGKNRWIEDPEPELKHIQRTLNELLQVAYYKKRPAAAFGFQLVLKNEKNPRNIKTNALCHLGKPWLINIDLSDFFHQITLLNIRELLEQNFPDWSKDLRLLVSKLCTYNGRLPMGAPTSPVLANWAVIALDHSLETYCKNRNIIYTRFVDDLSFSSLEEITEAKVANITSIIKAFGLKINKEKTKFYPPNVPKIVTGLRVDDRVEVEPGFIETFLGDIEKYKIAKEVQQGVGNQNSEFLEKAKQQLDGRLQFIEFIEGKKSEVYLKAHKNLENALNTNKYEVISWREIDYHHFIPKKP